MALSRVNFLRLRLPPQAEHEIANARRKTTARRYWRLCKIRNADEDTYHKDRDHRRRASHRGRGRGLRWLARRVWAHAGAADYQVLRGAAGFSSPGASILEHRTFFRRAPFSSAQRDDRQSRLLFEPVPV